MPWLLLFIIAKMKIKSFGADPDCEPISDFSQPELWLLASGLLPKGNFAGTTSSTSRLSRWVKGKTKEVVKPGCIREGVVSFCIDIFSFLKNLY